MLTSKQKKYLKSEAHSLKPIFQIGKDGVGTKQAKSISDALDKKELIKVKLLDTCPQSLNEVAVELSAKTKADVVNMIGHTIILYKQSEKDIYKLP
jgi:RNA-binding protein